MDIFVYKPSSVAAENEGLLLKNGELISDWTSLTWIERYRDASEFTIVSPLESGLVDLLPRGSIIAKVNSSEFMIVENHEISMTKNNSPEIVITGRSFDSFFEHRTIGDRSMTDPELVAEFSGENWYTSGSPEAHAAQLLQKYSTSTTHSGETYKVAGDNAGDSIENLLIRYVPIVPADPDLSDERTLSWGSVYKALSELLDLGDLGIKTIRPRWTENPELDSLINRTSNFCYVVIHQGIDKTSSVGFSAERGEIETADYFASNIPEKNSVIVQGKIVKRRLDTPKLGYFRRSTLVDGSDIEEGWTDYPTNKDRYKNSMYARAKANLRGSSAIEISNVVLAANLTQFTYRKDFSIGDLVGVEGEFGTSGVRRVIEYAEVQDENGYVSTPTLGITEE